MAMHLNYGFDSFSGLFFCLWNSGILYLTISEITKQCLYWRKFRQTDSLKTTLAVKILNLKTKMMNCLTQHGFRPFYRWTIFLFLLLRNRATLYLIISVISHVVGKATHSWFIRFILCWNTRNRTQMNTWKGHFKFHIKKGHFLSRPKSHSSTSHRIDVMNGHLGELFLPPKTAQSKLFIWLALTVSVKTFSN